MNSKRETEKRNQDNPEFELINKLLSELNPLQLKKVINTLDEKSLAEILVKKILEEKQKHHMIKIPVSIFRNKDLGVLETIVYYLKKNQNLKNRTICKMLCRSSQVIWTTFHNSELKLKHKLEETESEYDFYLSSLKDYSNFGFSMFESIIYHIKQTFDMSYSEIGLMFARSPSTINTIYNRAKKKVELNNE